MGLTNLQNTGMISKVLRMYILPQRYKFSEKRYFHVQEL